MGCLFRFWSAAVAAAFFFSFFSEEENRQKKAMRRRPPHSKGLSSLFLLLLPKEEQSGQITTRQNRKGYPRDQSCLVILSPPGYRSDSPKAGEPAPERTGASCPDSERTGDDQRLRSPQGGCSVWAGPRLFCWG